MVGFLVALLISIAIQIVAYILMPKPKPPKPEAAKDLESPSAEAGRPIPVVFGTVLVKGPNVLWFGEKSTHMTKVKA